MRRQEHRVPPGTSCTPARPVLILRAAGLPGSSLFHLSNLPEGRENNAEPLKPGRKAEDAT